MPIHIEIPENCGLHILVHMGDWDLHPGIGLSDTTRKTEVQRLICELVAVHAGSISGDHGIGLVKRGFLPHSRSPAEIALMRKLKQMLDPESIFNPGKIPA